MGGVVRFVFAIIWIALVLGVTGHLLDATVFAKKRAEQEYRSKGMSATWWNRKLLGIESHQKEN